MEQSLLIKNKLFESLDTFVNELDLTIDYLGKNIIPSIKKYIQTIKKDETCYKSFLEYTVVHLKEYETQISGVLFSKKKIKSEYYNFLNDITLFNNILHFKVFSEESKNTKKDLIKYIYSTYMSCVLLSQTDIQTKSDLSNRLTEFVTNIQQTADSIKQENIKVDNKIKNAMIVDNKMQDIFKQFQDSPTTQQQLPQGDFGGLMQSILGNKEILDIATDISKKMQSSQMNPMAMLSSLMSGNIENSPLQGLVEEIQQKVESKITSGEINKEALENQAKSVMESVSTNGANMNSMDGMSDLINNMMKNMQNNF